MKVLIIIPAYNEELNIERVVDELTLNYSQYDYIVVNDGSRDSTAEICRKRRYNLLDLPINLGLSGAVQAGMCYALKNGYDAAIQFDGDRQHRPEYIAEMLRVMEEEKADIVIGSRFIRKKKDNTLRMLGSNVISGIIRLSTGQKLTDPTSGMRLYNKRLLRDFAGEMNYGPEPDTISYLMKCGYKVREVEVKMDERIAGESYFSFMRSIRYMVLMVFSILFIQHFRKK